jgi:hypothetical protein
VTSLPNHRLLLFWITNKNIGKENYRKFFFIWNDAGAKFCLDNEKRARVLVLKSKQATKTD